MSADSALTFAALRTERTSMASTLRIEAADGHIVPAVHFRANADRLVILSHGITTGRDEDGTYTTFAEKVLNPHFDSIRFDFRGHGDSALGPKDATASGEVLDLMAVVRWARSQQYKELFHVATSFGSSITLLAASRFDLSFLKAVAFWNPVIDYDRTFIHSETPWGREFYNQAVDDELAYRSGTPVPETDFVIGPAMTVEMLLLRPQDTTWPPAVPLLVVHGDADSAVPINPAREYCLRNPSCTFHSVADVDHGFDEKLPSVFTVTTDWLLDHSSLT